MFEDSLLIIKCDYMHKRKFVLLHLLKKGFQIQGSRKLIFSPEQAAEFYKDSAEDRCFMLQVILLSKGNSEAFILSKENAIIDLLNTMVCYFTTSLEMDRNVHVSRTSSSVRREITFLFPNYIYEPIGFVDRGTFCQTKLITPMISELYDITQAGPEVKRNWKVKLAEWLTLNNKSLPRISTQCSYKPSLRHQEKMAQTTFSELGKGQPCSVHSASISTRESSQDATDALSSSSCISCTCFDGGEAYSKDMMETCVEMIKKKTQKVFSSSSISSDELKVRDFHEIFEEECREESEIYEDECCCDKEVPCDHEHGSITIEPEPETIVEVPPEPVVIDEPLEAEPEPPEPEPQPEPVAEPVAEPVTEPIAEPVPVPEPAAEPQPPPEQVEVTVTPAATAEEAPPEAAE